MINNQSIEDTDLLLQAYHGCEGLVIDDQLHLLTADTEADLWFTPHTVMKDPLEINS